VIGNVNISIPVRGTPIENLEKSIKDNICITDDNSLLKKFNNNKKNARYLLEHTIWLFSAQNYDLTDKNLNTFSKEFFEIKQCALELFLRDALNHERRSSFDDLAFHDFRFDPH
jgi:hypothetical protein